MNAVAPGETPSAQDMAFGLVRLNRVLNTFNSQKLFAYRSVFQTFTLTAGQQSRTIGPTGADFAVTGLRPEEIIAAAIAVTGSTPEVRYPMRIRDAAWWSSLAVRNFDASIPTDLYYSPGWPNGTLYIYPYPQTAYDIELQFRQVLSSLALGDTFTQPPAYEKAIGMTLAEDMCVAFTRLDVLPAIAAKAAKARAEVIGQNSNPPAITTKDAGMPGGSRKIGNFFNGFMP